MSPPGVARHMTIGASLEDIELDIAGGALLLGGQATRLRPKTLAVLVALIERQGEIVSQDDLHRLVWGNRHGADAGPKQCIRELRRVLGDGAPLIQTVGRQGYRLCRPVALRGARPKTDALLCVGRAVELRTLRDLAGAARRGRRAIGLIAGEAGAGKTRLTDCFLGALPQSGLQWIARGQAIPHPGAREPYGPLLEALSQLAGGSAGATVRRLLRDHAPSWADQLPGPDHNRDPGAIDPGPSRPDPMLRELSDLLERLTQSLPGILVLEDLHWADPSTLAWLSAWASRRAPARLLVLGTYRFDELDRAGDLDTTVAHLSRMADTSVLTLAGLGEGAVRDYLDSRFPGHRFPSDFAALLAHRTEGHAILIDAAVTRWLAQGAIARPGGAWHLDAPPEDMARAIASGVQGFIDTEVARLDPDERRLLDLASVAGPTFSPLDLSESRAALEETERRFDSLARARRFIEPAGVSHRPDGTVATRYAFRHALHHEALYAAIPAANRQGLHRRIGARLETVHGADAAEIAPALADHFERGADWPRAARYRGMSGLRALGRGAAPEAAAQLRQALDLHARCHDADPSAELRTLLGLGAALIVSDGFTGAELRSVYQRANALAVQSGDAAAVIPVLAGLWNDHVSRADLSRAAELAAALQELAAEAPDHIAMAAHNAVGQTRFFTGDFRACLPRIAAVLAMGPQASDDSAALFGEDPTVVCHQYAAIVCQVLGRDGEADAHVAAGSDRAETLDQPFARAQMLWASAVIARERGDLALTRDRAEALIVLCEAADVPFWLPAGRILCGWARAMGGAGEGAELLDQGIAGNEAMQLGLTMPYGLALKAEIAALRGETAVGFTALRRALRMTRTTGERWYEAELHRLWAALATRSGKPDSARRALDRAVSLATEQGAAAFVARAERQI